MEFSDSQQLRHGWKWWNGNRRRESGVWGKQHLSVYVQGGSGDAEQLWDVGGSARSHKRQEEHRQCLGTGTAAQFASKLLQLQLNLSEALPVQCVPVGCECSTLSSFESCFFRDFWGFWGDFFGLFWGFFLILLVQRLRRSRVGVCGKHQRGRTWCRDTGHGWQLQQRGQGESLKSFLVSFLGYIFFLFYIYVYIYNQWDRIVGTVVWSFIVIINFILQS